MQRVLIKTEDGREFQAYLDMRTVRGVSGREGFGIAAEHRLDISKPLRLRHDSLANAEIRIWFVEGGRIYGAYSFGVQWHLHAWFLDGGAMARKFPSNTDLIYRESEDEKKGAPGPTPEAPQAPTHHEGGSHAQE